MIVTYRNPNAHLRRANPHFKVSGPQRQDCLIGNRSFVETCHISPYVSMKLGAPPKPRGRSRILGRSPVCPSATSHWCACSIGMCVCPSFSASCLATYYTQSMEVDYDLSAKNKIPSRKLCRGRIIFLKTPIIVNRSTFSESNRVRNFPLSSRIEKHWNLLVNNSRPRASDDPT